MINRATTYDAVIIGAGPNGLSAGIVLARRGLRTLILEREATPGGGARTAELTLPGYRHDVCSAIHPMAAGSPFFQTLPLERYGLEWIHPPIPLAHPLDGGHAAILTRSVIGTAADLDDDRRNYLRQVAPLVRNADDLFKFILQPIRPDPRNVRHIRFGLDALRSASGLARAWFTGEKAKALFAGNAAHSFLRLDQRGSAAFGLALIVAAHRYGWPFPRRGSQSIVDALAAHYLDLGGELVTGVDVKSMADVPTSRSYVFDTTPSQWLDIAGDRLQGIYRMQAGRFRHGPGAFKVDYALNAPIPWMSAACRQAGTVHVGGRLEEIEAAELAVSNGRHPIRPFVLVAQQSLFDDSRAPERKHTAWAYCHVPAGSDVDMVAAIERQIERFAPGFGATIEARHIMPPLALEQYNPNYVGGDVSGGANALTQVLARPVLRLDSYSTPDPKIFVCSASTPPGGGVHGMCGYHAAQSVLRRLRAA